MNVEALWFLGAPIAGGGVIAAGVVFPRFKRFDLGAATNKDGARVLPLVARAVDVPSAPEPSAVVSGAPRADGGGPSETTDESHAAAETIVTASAPSVADASRIEADALPSNVARPAFGVRIATGLKRAFRRKPADPADAPSVVDAVYADIHADEGTGTVEPYTAPADRAGLEPLAVTILPAPPLVVASVPAGLVPLVASEDATTPHAAENGIIEVDAPPGEDPEAWRANVAQRERLLTEQDDEARRVRDASERDREQRAAEAEAHARQAELENIALAEEVRVRSEARARKWYARLDLDLEAPTIEDRMAMASSLAPVRAAWAGKLLREAFDQEEEARVRARVIGALVSGDHLVVTDPFVAAFSRGGIERAATLEMLMPRQHEAAWIADLLAPLLVA
jgi:hypothetical protein